MYDIYTVKVGDTISSIAAAYGVTPDVILNNNAMMPNSILYVGTKLKVPYTNEYFYDKYIVKQGDSLYSVGKSVNTRADIIAMINGLDVDGYIYPNQQLLVPKSGVSIYLTAEAETFESVARNMNATQTELLTQNRQIYLMPNQLILLKRNIF